MAMVSTRSSRRSFSSCSALRNEASEYGDRCSGSVLGESSVGNVQVSSPKSFCGSMLKSGQRSRERSAKAFPVSTGCAAKVADKIDLAVYGCATPVRRGLQM